MNAAGIRSVCSFYFRNYENITAFCLDVNCMYFNEHGSLILGVLLYCIVLYSEPETNPFYTRADYIILLYPDVFQYFSTLNN